MTDNELKALIRRTLLQLLAQQGEPDLRVVATYQPTSQGREERALYFFPAGDARYGWQGRHTRYNAEQGELLSTEKQHMTTRFQLQALAPADPQNTAAPTAGDLVKLGAMLISSRSFIEALRKGGVGLERITAIRTPQFINDQGRFETVPSFDFTVSYTLTLTQTAPAIDVIEGNCYTV